jgi:hypothetical protein
VAALAFALGNSAWAQEAPPPPTAAPAKVLFRLPIELGQGALFAQGGRDVRYSFSASVLPGFAYGVLDVNLLLSGIYRNPYPDCFTCTLDFGAGGRASVAVFSTLEQALSVRVGLETEYQVRAESARGAAGLMADLSSLLRLGLWVGHDWAASSYFWSLTLAVDPTTWGDPVGALLRAGPVEDFGNAPK